MAVVVHPAVTLKTQPPLNAPTFFRNIKLKNEILAWID